MANPVKNFAVPASNIYGVGPYYILAMTLVGQGSGKAPIAAAANDATNPPCAIEVAPTFVSTGINTLTFQDAYYAVAYASAMVDDVNNATPVTATLGQWTGLQTQTPATVSLTTYTGATTNVVDVALGTQIRLLIWFKKDPTGAAA